jgi:hypothetical protein
LGSEESDDNAAANRSRRWALTVGYTSTTVTFAAGLASGTTSASLELTNVAVAGAAWGIPLP